MKDKFYCKKIKTKKRSDIKTCRTVTIKCKSRQIHPVYIIYDLGMYKTLGFNISNTVRPVVRRLTFQFHFSITFVWTYIF